MNPGRFISFEGGEGVGKSTQAGLLTDALRERGLEVIRTREPGGTPGAEAIRTLLLDPAQDWPAEAESLLFAAARADHVITAIRPALERGCWVVCDRFVDSSRAYQGGEGVLFDTDLLQLHRIGSAGLLPDCTILLTASSAAVNERLHKRDGQERDRIGGRPAAYHARVAERFRAMASAEPHRFALVDAEGSPLDVHRRALHALAPLLGEGG